MGVNIVVKIAYKIAGNMARYVAGMTLYDGRFHSNLTWSCVIFVS